MNNDENLLKKFMKSMGIFVLFLGGSVMIPVHFFDMFSASTQNSNHIKESAQNYAINIRTFCLESKEYLIVNGNGTAATAILDSDGKPNKCNY